MKHSFVTTIVAVAVVLGLIAPSTANVSVGPHVGALLGTAYVGKNGTCDNDGSGWVGGGGLGWLPIPAKNAWYAMYAVQVIDVSNGFGSLDLCGQLTAPLQGTNGLDPKHLGIGASCVGHKGWDGYGRMTFPGMPDKVDKWLRNVGWKTTVGRSFVVTADVGGAKDKKSDLFVAHMEWWSEMTFIGCLSKDLGDKWDPDAFTVIGEYAIVPGAGGTIPQKEPKKP